MHFLALIQAIAAGLTPSNIQSYIDLVEKLISVAQVIDASAHKSQNPSQNGSAQS